MDKYLPDNIDDFFVTCLKNYTEEPEEEIWDVIDKRLTERERNKRSVPLLIVLSSAAIIIGCLLVPFLLVNPYAVTKHALQENLVEKKHANNGRQNNITQSVLIPKTNKNNEYVQPGKEHEALHFQAGEQQVDQVVKIPVNNLTAFNVENKRLLPDGFIFKNISLDDSLKTITSKTKTASITITIPVKHNFIISPFFSFDHITGRLIEQYEFDNADKNDYRRREKADMSFTAGVLAAYQLNKNFSILSGVSLSNSKLSISSTAVNALKDATGVYKFKLATSYGFAEISNSGIIPTAGDSLLISGASMQFNYISFPVLINYNLSNKKIKLSVHSGLALNKLTSEKVEAEYQTQNGKELETINKIEGIKRTFFTLNSGVEATYSVKPGMDVSISPELRYGINSINKGTPVKTYPINYGLAFHFNVKL